MPYENETPQQRAARFAALVRNAQTAKENGTLPGQNRLPYFKPFELVGAVFQITNIEFDVPNQLNPSRPQTVCELLFADGSQGRVSCTPTMTRQVQAFNEADIQDNAYTVIETGYYAAHGRQQMGYAFDAPTLEMLKATGNTAAKNRARVAIGAKSEKPAPSVPDFDNNDESEDFDESEDSDDILIITAEEWDSMNPTVQRKVRALVIAGEAKILPAEKPAPRKQVSLKAAVPTKSKDAASNASSDGTIEINGRTYRQGEDGNPVRPKGRAPLGMEWNRRKGWVKSR